MILIKLKRERERTLKGMDICKFEIGVKGKAFQFFDITMTGQGILIRHKLLLYSYGLCVV